MTERDGRPLAELRDTGLLWMINRSLFHPRGFALALVYDADGQCTGWELLGDGSEPWTYASDIDEAELLRRAEQTLREQAGGT